VRAHCTQAARQAPLLLHDASGLRALLQLAQRIACPRGDGTLFLNASACATCAASALFCKALSFANIGSTTAASSQLTLGRCGCFVAGLETCLGLDKSHQTSV
jgi:hypothetical protein